MIAEVSMQVRKHSLQSLYMKKGNFYGRSGYYRYVTDEDVTASAKIINSRWLVYVNPHKGAYTALTSDPQKGLVDVENTNFLPTYGRLLKSVWFPRSV